MTKRLIVQRKEELAPFPEDIAEVFRQTDGNSYPRLNSLAEGYAIFTSTFGYPRTNKRYRITCRLPLTDLLFTGKEGVFYLPPSKALPIAVFSHD